MSYSRRQVIIATAGLAALAATSANAESANAQRRSSDMDMDIKRNGSRPSAKGSPDWFTGSVRVDPLFQAPDPARWAVVRSPSNPAPARRGTRTRSVRR